MLADKVLKIIKKYNLLSNLDKILVGVSGGPDSIALLYLLNELKVKLGIKIVVAHFNHALRGKASDIDQEFVENISYRLGLKFVTEKYNWKTAKEKTANEDMLR